MKTKYKVFLAIDAFVNIALGLLLLSVPAGVLDVLGLPPTDTYFYASTETESLK